MKTFWITVCAGAGSVVLVQASLSEMLWGLRTSSSRASGLGRG